MRIQNYSSVFKEINIIIRIIVESIDNLKLLITAIGGLIAAIFLLLHIVHNANIEVGCKDYERLSVDEQEKCDIKLQ